MVVLVGPPPPGDLVQRLNHALGTSRTPCAGTPVPCGRPGSHTQPVVREGNATAEHTHPCVTAQEWVHLLRLYPPQLSRGKAASLQLVDLLVLGGC